jgi:hypothetical protein
MSNFGDVRSAAHARDREALRLALANYDDRVPPLEVVAYVKRLATLWPVTWRGGNGASDDVLYAHKHGSPTLSAYIMVGSHEIKCLALDGAETSIQRAMTPIRREALDLHWMPRAQEYDSEEVREATRLLYACLDDPTLRAAARYAAGAAAWSAARDSAWSAARYAAWSAAWSAARYAAGAAAWSAARDSAWAAAWSAARYAAWDAARDSARYAAGASAWDAAGAAAWEEINHRVGAAIIKEVLS